MIFSPITCRQGRSGGRAGGAAALGPEIFGARPRYIYISILYVYGTLEKNKIPIASHSMHTSLADWALLFPLEIKPRKEERHVRIPFPCNHVRLIRFYSSDQKVYNA